MYIRFAAPAVSEVWRTEATQKNKAFNNSSEMRTRNDVKIGFKDVDLTGDWTSAIGGQANDNRAGFVGESLAQMISTPLRTADYSVDTEYQIM